MEVIITNICYTTGKKILKIKLSLTDYNNLIHKLQEDHKLYNNLLKSFNQYCIKNNIYDLQLEIEADDIDMTILESLNNLSI